MVAALRSGRREEEGPAEVSGANGGRAARHGERARRGAIRNGDRDLTIGKRGREDSGKEGAKEEGKITGLEAKVG
jgi:hypothetical protein